MKQHVLDFVDCINRHDVMALAALMAEEHRFVDSVGREVNGREAMRAGWEGYFRMFPDYQITVDEVFENGDTFVLLGTARGTYSPDGTLREENRWEVPAAWKAVVHEGRIAEWRVYADNYQTVKLLAGRAK